MKKQMFNGAGNLIFKNVAAPRNHMTPAEMVLWGHLKGNQLGTKFRRQPPFGIYIVDFYCHQHKIILEVDGNIHAIPKIAKIDLERQVNMNTTDLEFFVLKMKTYSVN